MVKKAGKCQESFFLLQESGIKSIYLSSTMSKGIKIDPKTVEEN